MKPRDLRCALPSSNRQQLLQPLFTVTWKRHPLLVIPSEPGFPATLHWTQPRVRFSVRENRMNLANATNLNRKYGEAEGPAVRPSPKQLPATLSATIHCHMETPPSPLPSRGGCSLGGSRGICSSADLFSDRTQMPASDPLTNPILFEIDGEVKSRSRAGKRRFPKPASSRSQTGTIGHSQANCLTI
jgi:hypothetical protein